MVGQLLVFFLITAKITGEDFPDLSCCTTGHIASRHFLFYTMSFLANGQSMHRCIVSQVVVINVPVYHQIVGYADTFYNNTSSFKIRFYVLGYNTPLGA